MDDRKHKYHTINVPMLLADKIEEVIASARASMVTPASLTSSRRPPEDISESSGTSNRSEVVMPTII